MSKHTLIIAEAGVNHNGDIDIARRLIDVAVEAGADIVKFQTFKAEALVTSNAAKAEYQRRRDDIYETQFDMLKRLELTENMHYELIEYCRSRSIQFLSTGFDIASLDFLFSLGIGVFKIPSGEITNLPYLRHVSSFGLPVILSTGMSTLAEVEDAVRVFEECGLKRDMVTVLHCTTDYPTPMEDVNLMAMDTMRSALGVHVGYSDHTQGIEVAIAAVALGATVIEKHITLDRTMKGPDHAASIEPEEFGAMVNAIRNIEMALGNGIKLPSSRESANISVARKSIVARCAIKQGDVFTSDNLTVKRPGIGINPMLWYTVVGQVAPRDFAANELVCL